MVLRHCFVLSFCLIGLLFADTSLGQNSDTAGFRRRLQFPDAEPQAINRLRNELSQDQDVRIRILDDKGAILITSKSQEALDRVEETLVRGLSRTSTPADQPGPVAGGTMMSGLLGNSLGGSIDGDQLEALLGGAIAQQEQPYLVKYSTVDAGMMIGVIRTMMQGRKGVRMDIGPSGKSIVIYGLEADHKLVRDLLETLRQNANELLASSCYVSVSMVCSGEDLEGPAYRSLKASESVLLAGLAESGIIELDDPRVACGVASIVTAQEPRQTNRQGGSRNFQVEQGKFGEGVAVGIAGTAVRQGDGVKLDLGCEIASRTSKAISNASVHSSLVLNYNQVRLLGTCKIDNVNFAVLVEISDAKGNDPARQKMFRRNATREQRQSVLGLPAPSADDPPGPIRAELIPELETLLLKGRKADVDELVEQIQDLIGEVHQARPRATQIEITGDAGEIAKVLQQLYDGQLAALYGPVTIKPVPQNSALLVIGSEKATELIKQILKQYEPHGPSIAELDRKPESTDAETYRTEAERKMMMEFMRALQKRSGDQPSAGTRGK